MSCMARANIALVMNIRKLFFANVANAGINPSARVSTTSRPLTRQRNTDTIGATSRMSMRKKISTISSTTEISNQIIVFSPVCYSLYFFLYFAGRRTQAIGAASGSEQTNTWFDKGFASCELKLSYGCLYVSHGRAVIGSVCCPT